MATATITEPTSAANGNIPFVGADPGDGGDGNTLREAITRINARIKEIYGAQNSGGVVQTPFIDNDNIKDNAVDHDELANRYTAINAIGTTSGAFNIDFSAGAVHTVALGGSHTGTFTNFKVGQVIDIILSGNHTLTFSATASGTPSINKVGSTDYDGSSSTQVIQVVCTSASASTPQFLYSVATYADDTTP